MGSSDSETFEITRAATTTTVTCPVSETYTGAAIEPCSATCSGPMLNQTLTVDYTNNINVGTATASATYALRPTTSPAATRRPSRSPRPPRRQR